MAAAEFGLARAPVLDWKSFSGASGKQWPAIDTLPQVRSVTSGRAAIYQALRLLAPPSGSVVLLPTYHCPTMIAPALLNGLQVRYYPLLPSGLPDLATIDTQDAKVMLVSHYFGLPQSLADVRKWCDTHGLALIEDCAHTFFGRAGERTVGAWGDYATASASKFFPVLEAGLLASAHHDIPALELAPQGMSAELRGMLDMFESSARYSRAGGPGQLLKPLFAAKTHLRSNGRVQLPSAEMDAAPADAEAMLQACVMERIGLRTHTLSRLFASRLPRARMIEERRANYQEYLGHFLHVAGLRPLFPALPADAVPYAFPLWVDDPEPMYAALRAARMPVFRWDRLWPDTPDWPDDSGQQWSHHVLQFLCNQSLRRQDIQSIAQCALSSCATKP